jgi:hypothetical protein
MMTDVTSQQSMLVAQMGWEDLLFHGMMKDLAASLPK